MSIMVKTRRICTSLDYDRVNVETLRRQVMSMYPTMTDAELIHGRPCLVRDNDLAVWLRSEDSVSDGDVVEFRLLQAGKGFSGPTAGKGDDSMALKGTVKFRRPKKSAMKAKKGTINKCPHGTFKGRAWGSHTRWNAGCKQYGTNGKEDKVKLAGLKPLRPAKEAARSQGASAIFNSSVIFRPGRLIMKGLHILNELGIRGYTLTESDVKGRHLPAEAEGGFFVSKLDPEAIGAKGGIKDHDVITTVNEKRITKMVDLTDDASPLVLTCFSNGKTKYVAFQVSHEEGQGAKKGKSDEVSATNGHVGLEGLPEMIKEGFKAQYEEIERLNSKFDSLQKQAAKVETEFKAAVDRRDRAVESVKKALGDIKT